MPEILQHKISLAQHVKATRYDIARTKLNLLEVTFTTSVILVLTKFHGIDYLSEILMNQVGDLFAFHWMLPALVAFIFILVDLPFTWMRDFRLREAYGYTRTQPRQWLIHFSLTSLIGWLSMLPILWIGLWFWRQSGSVWWLIGWGFFSIYLIIPLHLARRLYYFFRPLEAKTTQDQNLLERIKEIGLRSNIKISEIRITQAKHNEDLPPAFAFGHRKGVRIYFRNDVFEKLSQDSLLAIGAHALSRNLSHMYLQAWAVCSLVGLFVFAFLAWLAPQSWFLDEIGFKAIGPGPYYGSLLAFTIVALPVLLFPFKLPMEAFLRHLIFKSDIFALHCVGLNAITNALIELTPTPMRHSCLTLESFDLLFSHEPSLMARINHIRNNCDRIKMHLANKDSSQTRLELRHTIENVQSALQTQRAQEKLLNSIQKDVDERNEAKAQELRLIEQAQNQRTIVEIPLKDFVERDELKSENLSEIDNTQHRTYHMGLIAGLIDLVKRIYIWQRHLRLRGQIQTQNDTLKLEQNTIASINDSILPTPEQGLQQNNSSSLPIKGAHSVDLVSKKRKNIALAVLKQREQQLNEKNHGKKL